ncbi:MAG: PIN domain-containing protein [Bacteroidetes bacterium]|nr:MAG: PIN domain-containing protein [Bacteroidota bacterium]
MKDSFFMDTNIALYAICNKGAKSEIAQNLLSFKPIISTQVVTESVNVMIKKLKFSKIEAFEKASDLLEVCTLSLIKESSLNIAFEISKKYQFSYWDSLIVAVALESNCETLYSEDMSHNLLIDGKVKILNPFF